ncbi:MAG: hypothetical protein U1E65_29240 [Myxococcota bacterium]
MRRWAILGLLATATACGGSSGGTDGGVDAGSTDAAEGRDAGQTDGSTTAPSWLTELRTADDYHRLAAPQTSDLKYLLTVDGRPIRPPITAPCLFQNTAAYPYHVVFLHQFTETSTLSFDDYSSLVLRRPTRVWWGGGLTILDANTIAYAIYAENGATVGLVEDDVAEVDRKLKGCAPWADALLGFLPQDPFQEQFARAHQASLLGRGVRVILH